MVQATTVKALSCYHPLNFLFCKPVIRCWSWWWQKRPSRRPSWHHSLHCPFDTIPEQSVPHTWSIPESKDGDGPRTPRCSRHWETYWNRAVLETTPVVWFSQVKSERGTNTFTGSEKWLHFVQHVLSPFKTNQQVRCISGPVCAYYSYLCFVENPFRKNSLGSSGTAMVLCL